MRQLREGGREGEDEARGPFAIIAEMGFSPF
jgi:hypothetical protein